MLRRCFVRWAAVDGVGSGGQRKVTALELAARCRKGHRPTMVSCYTYSAAAQCSAAGIDSILVGDSVGMVELGYATTQPVTMQEMIHHCRAVARGASTPFLVGDMPMGSYEINDDEAMRNAYRFIKEGSMDAVKLEGGSAARAATVARIVQGGVPVVGHIGLTPQAIGVIGGFRAQGRTAEKARALVLEAERLEAAGCCALVIECVPSPVAALITRRLRIPTIGIGAGQGTSGQVLVYNDMLGMANNPHHAAFSPKFCKQFANVGKQIFDGLTQFKAEVGSGAFPDAAHSPYKIGDEELEALTKAVAEGDAVPGHHQAAAPTEDEYEKLQMYGSAVGSVKPQA